MSIIQSFTRSWAAVLLYATLCYGSDPPRFAVTPAVQAALDQISAESLRGHLSFLASDLLEGRNTPSRGLDLAAEYIAAQFRRAGLEPGGDDGYFQTARLFLQEPDLEGFELKLTAGEREVSIPAASAALSLNSALSLTAAPIFKLDFSDTAAIDALTPDRIRGNVFFAELPRGRSGSARATLLKLRASKPALLLTLDRTGAIRPLRQAQLADPEDQATQTPRILISGDDAIHFFDALPSGLAPATLTLHVADPKRQPTLLRNVVGILRGSDPVLKDSCVLVTAHYDHLGVKPSGEGDRIFNGANDDGSGTVSVIELGAALSTLKQHPRRSIVFVTFFGEEKGGFGSRYYARHPVFPIAQTVADVNLEQVGRTDSTQGPQIANATLTGFDYSNVADSFKAAGELTGVKVYKDDKNSDSYFARSDNQSLADQGVPAHTLCVAFQYPDYHGVADEWQKIDYPNLAKVDRMVALALLMLAGSAEVPHWDASNPKAQPYLKAWNQHHAN